MSVSCAPDNGLNNDGCPAANADFGLFKLFVLDRGFADVGLKLNLLICFHHSDKDADTLTSVA